MAYILAAAIILPIVMTIWTYNPTWELEQQAKDEGIEISPPRDNPLPIIFFGFLIVWLLILGRILYLWKRGAYSISTKY